MELAVIPPVAHLDDVRQMRYQLVLPHLFTTNTTYAKHYLDLPQSRYIILDNGAAEDVSVPFNALYILAQVMNAQEVALPDVLHDSKATYDMSYEAALTVERSEWKCKLGYVLQGKEPIEALNRLDMIMKRFGHLINVVYIPRLWITHEQQYIRLHLAKEVHRKYPDVEIHLFGASQQFFGEISAASAYPYIRSIDTSAPYTFAVRDRHVDRSWYPIKVRRPNGYFDMHLTGALHKKALINISTMEGWCHECNPQAPLSGM